MHEEENFKNNKTTNVINPFIFLEIHYESRVECNIKKGTFRGSPPPAAKDTKNMVKWKTEVNGLKNTVKEATGIPSPEHTL